MRKLKRIIFLVRMWLKWEIFGQPGITWQEFKQVFSKEIIHCYNASD